MTLGMGLMVQPFQPMTGTMTGHHSIVPLCSKEAGGGSLVVAV